MKPGNVWLVLPLVLGLWASRAGTEKQHVPTRSVLDDLIDTGRAMFSSNSNNGELKVLFEVVTECFSTDFFACVKRKAIAVLDRASRSYGKLKLSESVYFVRNPDAKEVDEKSDGKSEGRSMNDADNEIPRGGSDDSRLDGLLWKKIGKFLSNHNLRFNINGIMPGYALQFSQNKKDKDAVDVGVIEESSFEGRAAGSGRDGSSEEDYDWHYQDSGSDEKKGYGGFGGGGKKGKGKGGGMMKMSMMTMKVICVGVVIAIATKAAMMSMVGIVLATAMALRKKEEKEESTYEVVSHEGHRRRNNDMSYGGHDLAYNSYYSPQSPYIESM